MIRANEVLLFAIVTACLLHSCGQLPHVQAVVCYYYVYMERSGNGCVYK